LFSNRFRLGNENFHCLFSNPQAGEIFKLEEATLGNQNSIEAIVQSISKIFNCKVVMDGHMPQHH